MLVKSTGYGTQQYQLPEDVQMDVWSQRESRDSEPENRWPACDLGRKFCLIKCSRVSFIKFSSRGTLTPRWRILEVILKCLPKRVSQPKRL